MYTHDCDTEKTGLEVNWRLQLENHSTTQTMSQLLTIKLLDMLPDGWSEPKAER